MSAQNDILAMALDQMQKTQGINPVSLTAWFDDATVVDFSGNVLTLHTPNDFKKDIITERFLIPLTTALRELMSSTDIEVTVTTGEMENAGGVSYGLTPDDGYTFEQFIVGNSNKFAHAAALSVAKNPAQFYNPLFIYGQSGLGKTHLLYAIAAVIRKNHPSYRIIYVKGEDFTNELVSAIQEGDVQNFRGKYRMADLLLIDDIQFIAGKERTQEEFFHTFNALYEAHKQIVLTSDRPPKEINTLEDRMKTRFEWGLLADIQPPDYETRMAITRAKAEKLGFDLPGDVVQVIAKTLHSNVRQIEGTIKKIQALHNLLGQEINTDLANRAIEEVRGSDEDLIPTPPKILQAVANYYSIPVEQIVGSRRSKDTVQPRQVAMYLVRELTNYSLPEIGKVFSRDHTTVLHSINKIEDERKSSAEMDAILKTLISNIQP